MSGSLQNQNLVYLAYAIHDAPQRVEPHYVRRLRERIELTPEWAAFSPVLHSVSSSQLAEVPVDRPASPFWNWVASTLGSLEILADHPQFARPDSPQVVQGWEWWGYRNNPTDIVNCDLAILERAQVLLVDTSTPSWGVAMEMVYARKMGIPVIGYYQRGHARGQRDNTPSPWCWAHLSEMHSFNHLLTSVLPQILTGG